MTVSVDEAATFLAELSGPADDMSPADSPETAPEATETVEAAEEPSEAADEPEAEGEALEAAAPDESTDERGEEGEETEEEAKADSEDEPKKPSKSSARRKRKLARMNEQLEKQDERIVELESRDVQWQTVADTLKEENEGLLEEIANLEAQLGLDNGDLREAQRQNRGMKARMDSDAKAKERREQAPKDAEVQRLRYEAEDLAEEHSLDLRELIEEWGSPRAQRRNWTMEDAAESLLRAQRAEEVATQNERARKQITKNRNAPKPVGKSAKTPPVDYAYDPDGTEAFIDARRAGKV